MGQALSYFGETGAETIWREAVERKKKQNKNRSKQNPTKKASNLASLSVYIFYKIILPYSSLQSFQETTIGSKKDKKSIVKKVSL